MAEMLDGQMTLFDFIPDPNNPEPKVPVRVEKPIRIVEMFAGYGSQSMALDRIGADYEIWFVSELDKYAIKSYNSVHKTNYPTIDISTVKGSDLNITDTDKYMYLMTYSFPCTDISVAGKQEGFSKDSETRTRSGLLWEVERILTELVDAHSELPQILFMENVKNIISKRHKPDFDKWCEFLESIGYVNFYNVLNAADYGIPQHRERTFMFSFLRSEFGNNPSYEFPNKIPLNKVLRDILEDEVPENMYINSDRAKQLIDNLIERSLLEKECASST